MDYKLPDLVLLKLASLCNMDCTYCYWFKDKSVYTQSKLITQDVLDAFYVKLEQYISDNRIRTFTVVFHGGEPLLVGKKRLADILYMLNSIQIRQDMQIKCSIQTNGLLIDNEWIDIFKSYRVEIGVSIDGPNYIHDHYRKDLKGRPTFEKVCRSIELLQYRSARFGTLSVCNPEISPDEICTFFIDTLGIKYIDILIPNATFSDVSLPNIGKYYFRLYELWREKYSTQNVSIRFVKNIIDSLNGSPSTMQSIGYNEVNLFMIKPDGQMEGFDALHYLGTEFTRSDLNIKSNCIADITKDPAWREIYRSSLTLNEKCNQCRFKLECGGGMISTRWSDQNRFNNPSVYCDQLYELFENISTSMTVAKVH